MEVSIDPSLSSGTQLQTLKSDDSNQSRMESYPGGVFRNKRLHFPWKLHQVLDETSGSSNFCNVIAWMPDGKSFKVFDKERLEQEVMSQHFSSCKFRSFQRSLNLWGFRVVHVGKEKGHCYHPLFIRGMPDLCCNMERTTVKVPGRRTKKGIHDQDRQQKMKKTVETPSSEARSTIITTATTGALNLDLTSHSFPLSSTTPPLLRNTSAFASHDVVLGLLLDTSRSLTPAAAHISRLSFFPACSLLGVCSRKPMVNNSLITNPSLLAGLLLPSFSVGRSHQEAAAPLQYTPHGGIAALERFNQEQQMARNSISIAILAKKLLSPYGGNQKGFP